MVVVVVPVVFICGSWDCMWWWLYVVVEVGGARCWASMCGSAWGYYCMIVYVHGGCSL